MCICGIERKDHNCQPIIVSSALIIILISVYIIMVLDRTFVCIVVLTQLLLVHACWTHSCSVPLKELAICDNIWVMSRFGTRL